MIGVWVPATKEQAIEALVARSLDPRDSELSLVTVMAGNYDSNGQPGEFDGLDEDDYENYIRTLADGVDLMDEWGPFRLMVEVPSIFAPAIVGTEADLPIVQTELNDAITAYRAVGTDFGLLTKAREALADALRWECSSCRPDVGWPDAVHMHGDFIHIECGHCGNDYTFTLTGEEVN